ncbi:MAG: early E1A protein [Clostridiales bacterium]|nr:early E1A protein [Clostridiales bacterium]MCC8177218.1 hypothetical protein [Bacteroidales bacterium]
MRAHRNGRPEVCASNLLRIMRGEVPYERVKGRDGALVDKPNATDDVIADAEWLLETFEPRVQADSIEASPTDALNGDFMTAATISKKEDEEE